MVLAPQDFSARLAALVPGLRSHLTRYHGVFAPHAKWRSLIGPGKPPPPAAERPPAERHRAMTSAQRLARVFRIDVTRCDYCGGPVPLTARGGAGLDGPVRGPPMR